jgi:DHA2 family multidrug resistance protein-like MFS transporter
VPAQDTEAARETLGGAAEVAAGLPAETAAAFLAEAGQAFVTGMHVVLLIAALLAAYVAVQAVVLLRGSRGAGVAPTDQPALETAMAAR